MATSFASPSGGVRQIIQPSISAINPLSNDPKSTFQTLKRSESEHSALFFCSPELAYLTVVRARGAAKMIKEGRVDRIIIIGDKPQTLLTFNTLEAESVDCNRMKIVINKSNDLIDATRLGYGEIRNAIRNGSKVHDVKVFAPKAKSEELKQNYRDIKRKMPELNGVLVQHMWIKGEPDKKPIDNLSLQVNPGRLASRHLFDWFGKNFMASFLTGRNSPNI